MSTAERLSALEVHIDDLRLERAEVETAAGWSRVTTTVVLDGAGHEGRGEDVCYEPSEHEGFPTPDLIGSGSLADVSRALAAEDLWPAEPPGYKASPDYRLWAFESAALDLALRQAGVTLGDVLDRSSEPVRFAISSIDDPAAWLAVDDSLEFKLDVASSWDEDTMRSLAATGRVRVVDFKAYYDTSKVDSIDDPATYALVASIFEGAILEDAMLNEETLAALDGALDRLSFDAPVHSVQDVLELAVRPRQLNIKPSRFGTVERLFDCLDWCEESGVGMYGGGQFELGIGREQIQALASLFYADSANDVAPADYNTATEPQGGLPRNPLPVPGRVVGFAFGAV